MVLGDVPANYEHQKQKAEEVRVEDGSRERLSTDSFLLASNVNTPKSGEKMNTAVTNIGAVDSMDLPQGWTKGKEVSGIAGLGSASSFNAPSNKEIEMTLFDRGTRYSANAAAFHEILSKPPHVLTPKELESLGAILGTYGDSRAFKMSACKTESINGKNVIVIEGNWKEVNHDSYSILANPDGKGETVQEIYFKAPHNDYGAYLNSAKQSMKAIRWK